MVGGDSEGLDEARLQNGGKLREPGPSRLQQALIGAHGKKIRIGEVAVVVGFFFGPHGEGGASFIIPAAGFVGDGLPFFAGGDLSSDLVG